MELDERKKVILQAVIRNYLETGEPVGSRTISKYTDLKLSSATIRNEMADLEEMGYIFQPHTSAGRIPSDKGYRFYVDSMLESKDRRFDEMKDMLIERQDKMEDLLKSMASLLAANTEYATMISAPAAHRNKLKFIQLSRVDAEQLLCVVVAEGNVIKNSIIKLERELTDEIILKLNILMNTCMNGLAIEEINLAMISRMKEQAGIHEDIVGSVIDAVAQAVRSDDDPAVYTSGATNIFKYPELSDNIRASQLINAFEDKKLLTDLIDEKSGDDKENPIQVYIGEEAPLQAMKDCSVVTATYRLGDDMKGTIGIVGPKRMDYAKVISALEVMQQKLDDLYNPGG
ncbi:MAG: heat-inducible transcriptional repressor HrcA [Lachnospiraceae bacterium]|nr:heat-inducible transcriptional repressor HrcA [Lachnospiraceae bacterium]